MRKLNKWMMELRREIRKIEKRVGLEELSETERAVYSLIEDSPTIIEDIIHDVYFKYTSRSTIKRAVVSLKDKGIIFAETSKIDARQMILTVTEK
jgi:DNA-binding MarR family transcriptional regulator